MCSGRRIGCVSGLGEKITEKNERQPLENGARCFAGFCDVVVSIADFARGCAIGHDQGGKFLLATY